MTHETVGPELASGFPSFVETEQDPAIQMKKGKEYFERIAKAQKKIEQIKTDLNQLIEAMKHNPSLLSRAASFWYERPMWLKIIAGVVLTVPLLVIGILTHLAALITFSVVSIIVYYASSFLLDNHWCQNKGQIESLKTGISALSDLLEGVILSLESISEQLAIEVDLFQKQNVRFTANIEELGGQINTLTSRITELADTEKNLRATQLELELTVTTLKGTVGEQSETLEKTQKELDKVVEDYKENQTQLADKITELDDVKVKMGQQIEQAQVVVKVLQGAVQTCSKVVIQDKEQRAVFIKKLEEFLADKEKSFIEFVERLSEAEEKLAVVTKQLEQTKQRYRELLDMQEQQISRLEQVDVQDLFNAVKPSINGFYAIKKSPSLPDEPISDAVPAATV